MKQIENIIIILVNVFLIIVLFFPDVIKYSPQSIIVIGLFLFALSLLALIIHILKRKKKFENKTSGYGYNKIKNILYNNYHSIVNYGYSVYLLLLVSFFIFDIKINNYLIWLFWFFLGLNISSIISINIRNSK